MLAGGCKTKVFQQKYLGKNHPCNLWRIHPFDPFSLLRSGWSIVDGELLSSNAAAKPVKLLPHGWCQIETQRMMIFQEVGGWNSSLGTGFKSLMPKGYGRTRLAPRMMSLGRSFRIIWSRESTCHTKITHQFGTHWGSFSSLFLPHMRVYIWSAPPPRPDIYVCIYVYLDISTWSTHAHVYIYIYIYVYTQGVHVGVKPCLITTTEFNHGIKDCRLKSGFA